MYQKTIILLAVLLTSLRSCSSSYPFDPKYDTSMSPDVYLETNHLHGHITRNSHMKNRHGYGPASSPRAFNVKAFGAKANGNDDSQVSIIFITIETYIQNIFYIYNQCKMKYIVGIQESLECSLFINRNSLRRGSQK